MSTLTFHNFTISRITPADDAAMAEIVRYNLAENGLNIPGTAYFDPELDHLSGFYRADPAKRDYFIVKDSAGTVVGGAGLAECAEVPGWCELQKLYLSDAVKGQGLGKFLVGLIESRAAELGYGTVYLETHSNLRTAIFLYEKLGYREVPRPDWVSHSTMNRFYCKAVSRTA